MSDSTKTLGLGTDIAYGGKTYTLAPWTIKTMGLFERWVKRQAWAAFEEDKDALSPQEQLEARRELLRMGGAGEWKFGGAAVQQALTSLPGIQYSLLLLLRENHPEVDEELVDKLVVEKLEEIMAAMEDANADPTQPAEVPANPTA